MKKQILCGMTALWTACALAQPAPVRVALLDFESSASQRADPLLGGAVDPQLMAGKGALLLGEQLAGKTGFTLIDRRDFVNQIERMRPTDQGRPTTAKPTFIQAAQALRADAVLRGMLMGLSTGRKTVNLGGLQTDFVLLTVDVSIEALDPVDGTVLAMASGSASADFRQTDAVKTQLSESDVQQLYAKAIAQAAGAIGGRLQQQAAHKNERPKIKLSIATTADPALIEIDGILVGSTPLENFELYKGDHVLTIGKAGYNDITKRILFEKDSKIQVPMIRVQLSAEEMKEMIEKMRIHVNIGEPVLTIQNLTD